MSSTTPQSLPARVVLEDGRVFRGRSFGAAGQVVAEVVFNTSHTGYQEVLTDPSYRFEAVTFTVPILGIYGVADEADDQSAKPQAASILCREVSHRSSNWRARKTLPEHLAELGLVGVEQLDTRSLVKHLRDKGSKNGVITTDSDAPDADLVDLARSARHMAGLDLVREVTCQEPYTWDQRFGIDNAPWRANSGPAVSAEGRRVVVVDFGIKRDILRHLASRGMQLTVVPAHTSADEILALEPDGVFLSNGPGDPSAVSYAIETVRALVAAERCPIYAICLGHQLMCLALGARTHKLKFGHRGGNHPVRDIGSGQVKVTSHNHGFAVDPASLASTPLEPTFESLFDGCLEGVRHRELPIKTVQFHPEAAPGPHEAGAFFDDFAAAISGAPVHTNTQGAS
jgi:carbamoyl-phosphate synthase small subunit